MHPAAWNDSKRIKRRTARGRSRGVAAAAPTVSTTARAADERGPRVEERERFLLRKRNRAVNATRQRAAWVQPPQRAAVPRHRERDATQLLELGFNRNAEERASPAAAAAQPLRWLAAPIASPLRRRCAASQYCRALLSDAVRGAARSTRGLVRDNDDEGVGPRRHLRQRGDWRARRDEELQLCLRVPVVHRAHRVAQRGEAHVRRPRADEEHARRIGQPHCNRCREAKRAYGPSADLRSRCTQ